MGKRPDQMVNGLVKWRDRAFFLSSLGLMLGLLLSACAKPSTLPAPPTPSTPTPRETIMQEAIKSYLGTPYKLGGTSYDGIDCSGLVMRVYQRAGIDIPRSTREQLETGKMVALRDLRFGDLLFFKNRVNGQRVKSLHVGLFMGDGRFAHASKTRGVVVEHLNSDHWRELFVGGRRFL
jgi:cell wall-associated NlpC family hydrolase